MQLSLQQKSTELFTIAPSSIVNIVYLDDFCVGGGIFANDTADHHHLLAPIAVRDDVAGVIGAGARYRRS